MKVLITGGAGFIGSHLADTYIRRDDEVHILDNLSTGVLSNVHHLIGKQGFKHTIGGVEEETVLAPLIDWCDIVYHLAASVGVQYILTHPVQTIVNNVAGTESVLRWAHTHDKKVFIASTSEVYGKNHNLPFTEADNLLLGPSTKPRWGYACSKLMDEFLALAYAKERGLDVVVGRFFNTVGPRQTGRYGMVLPRFVKQALKDEPITVYGDGSHIRTFTYVGDVVKAMIALMSNNCPDGDVYNIGGAEAITISGLAELVKRTVGSRSPIQHIPFEEIFGDDFEETKERVPCTTKIHAATGWEPETNLVTTIKKVAEYYRENPDG